MLRFMRKHATGFFVKALFGLIIVVFIFWGVGSYQERDKVVAKVGPYKITHTQYRENYTRLLNFYRSVMKDQFDAKTEEELKLRERAMDELVNQALLLIIAGDIGVSVSEREFIEYVGQMGNFIKDGKFEKNLYLETLKRNGIDPKQFEETERKKLLMSKVARIISDIGTSLSEEDLRQRYLVERGMVRLAYVVFDPADYTNRVNVTEKVLSDAYEKQKDFYRTENAYRLKKITIDGKSSLKDDAVYLELLKEKDIEEYCKRKGLEITDIGLVKESDLNKKTGSQQLVESLKGMKKGEVSLPVREGGRSFIYVLVEKEEGKPLEKNAVLAELKEKLRLSEAKEMAKSLARESITKETSKSASETDYISRNASVIRGIGEIPKEHAAILQLNAKKTTYDQPVEISGKYYVFRYDSVKEPDQKTWEKEKERFKQAYEMKSREEFLKSVIDETKKREKVQVNWEEI